MSNFPYMQFDVYNPIDNAISTAMGVYEGIGKGNKRNLEIEKMRMEQPYWEEQARMARDLERINLETAPALAQAEISRAQTAAAQARSAQQQADIALKQEQRNSQLHPYLLNEKKRENEQQDIFHNLGLYHPSSQKAYSMDKLYESWDSNPEAFYPQDSSNQQQQSNGSPFFSPNASGLSDQYGIDFNSYKNTPEQSMQPTQGKNVSAWESYLNDAPSTIKTDEEMRGSLRSELRMGKAGLEGAKSYESEESKLRARAKDDLSADIAKQSEQATKALGYLNEAKNSFNKLSPHEYGWLMGDTKGRSSDAQKVDSAVKNMVLSIVKMLGSQISDNDIIFLTETMPSRKMNKESFNDIADYAVAAQERVGEHRKFLDKGFRENKDPRGLEFKWQDYNSDFPIIEKLELDRLEKERGG